MRGGIVAPIVSPCSVDGSLDVERLVAHADRLLNANVDGLYICGGTGDSANLSFRDRMRVSSIAVPMTLEHGRSAIVHVGQATAGQSVRLAEHAAELGAHGVAAIPPTPLLGDSRDYYRSLAKVGLPVFAYVIPAETGSVANFADISSVLTIDGVAGAKVSDWNVFLLRELKRRFPDQVFYSGYDEMLLYGLLAGADGAIGTWINLMPRFYLRIRQAVLDQRLNEALELHRALSDFLGDCWKYGVIESFSAIMAARGWAARCFRGRDGADGWRFDRRTVARLVERASRLDSLELEEIVQ